MVDPCYEKVVVGIIVWKPCRTKKTQKLNLLQRVFAGQLYFAVFVISSIVVVVVVVVVVAAVVVAAAAAERTD